MTYGEAVRTPTISAHPDFEADNSSPSMEARLRALEEKMQNPSVDNESLSQDSTTPTSIQNLIQTSVNSMGNTLRDKIPENDNGNAQPRKYQHHCVTGRCWERLKCLTRHYSSP